MIVYSLYSRTSDEVGHNIRSIHFACENLSGAQLAPKPHTVHIETTLL